MEEKWKKCAFCGQFYLDTMGDYFFPCCPKCWAATCPNCGYPIDEVAKQTLKCPNCEEVLDLNENEENEEGGGRMG